MPLKYIRSAVAESPKEQEIMKSNPSTPLTLAALLSIAIAAVHLATIPFGASGLRYLAAPQRLVEMAERGDHLVPTVAVVGLFVVFSTFALYAWSGAGRMRKLPGLGFVLLVITSIYILRGVVVVPQIPISVLDPDAVPLRRVAFSAISLLIGLVHLRGIAQTPDLAPPFVRRVWRAASDRRSKRMAAK